ncbi:acyl-CoA dehydrogenase [Pseudomonas aeruginosa]|nr:acyl-CoA dehydrogenase [Pseudomonas aeruginosa]
MQRQIFETEHNLFRDAFRAFLDKEVVPHQDAWEEAGVVDRAVWRKAGEMGFLLPWADESTVAPGSRTSATSRSCARSWRGSTNRAS